MIPMRITETDREDFDEPVVELWRDDEFIGMVFWDEDTAVVQIYADDDGDVKDLDARELIRVIDLAERIVSPVSDDDEFADIRLSIRDAVGDEGWEDEDPATMALVEEFDALVVHRSEDGEGFFTRAVGQDFIKRCDELGLAVVEMEASDFDGTTPDPRADLSFTVRAEGVSDWEVFQPAANVRASDTLTDWPEDPSLVVSFVVQQPDGETFVA
jgi:hypothetical protein